MKKIFITMVLLTALHLSAQEKGGVELGFGIGYNGSSAYTAEGGPDSKGGFNVAGSVDYFFSPSWSIKGKLIYDKKGWSNGLVETETGFVTTDIHLNYLTIPVMANWHFGRKKNWYLNFGPYAGFLLNAKESRFDQDIKEFFSPTDFGLSLGIGVKIPLNDKLKLYIEYEEQFGLSNTFKESDLTVHNTRSSFNVGVNYILK